MSFFKIPKLFITHTCNGKRDFNIPCYIPNTFEICSPIHMGKQKGTCTSQPNPESNKHFIWKINCINNFTPRHIGHCFSYTVTAPATSSVTMWLYVDDDSEMGLARSVVWYQPTKRKHMIDSDAPPPKSKERERKRERERERERESKHPSSSFWKRM